MTAVGSKSGIIVLFLVLFLLYMSVVAAHEEEIEAPDTPYHNAVEDKAMKLKDSALRTIMISSIISALFLTGAFTYYKKKKRKEGVWRVFFAGVTIPLLVATVYTTGVTVYVNTHSATHGPVHWHADFELWKCGEKIDLKEPEGLSNRIGSSLLHEHGDNRIHIEGVVSDTDDVALHHFFDFIGGRLTSTEMVVPTTQGNVKIVNKDLCDGHEGKLQAFVYRVINPLNNGKWLYTQQKIEDFTNHIIAPYSTVPPGDCIIIDFDGEKEKTEHLCSSYRQATERGELRGS